MTLKILLQKNYEKDQTSLHPFLHFKTLHRGNIQCVSVELAAGVPVFCGAEEGHPGVLAV